MKNSQQYVWKHSMTKNVLTGIPRQETCSDRCLDPRLHNRVTVRLQLVCHRVSVLVFVFCVLCLVVRYQHNRLHGKTSPRNIYVYSSLRQTIIKNEQRQGHYFTIQSNYSKINKNAWSDLLCVEWDVKLYYFVAIFAIPQHVTLVAAALHCVPPEASSTLSGQSEQLPVSILRH